jgi:hypothetical protein
MAAADAPPLPGDITQPPGRLTNTGVTNGTIHREVEGVVSMEAENAYWWRGFDLYHGTSGHALRLRENNTRGKTAEANIIWKVRFSQTGRYALYNLGKIDQVKYAGNEINVFVDCGSSKDVDTRCGRGYVEDWEGRFYSRTYPGRWEAKDGYGGWSTAEYHWSSRMKEGKTSKATGDYAGSNEAGCPCYEEGDMVPPIIWDVAEPGLHYFSYGAANEAGMYFDKVVLKKVDPRSAPSGAGPAETVDDGSTHTLASAVSIRRLPAAAAAPRLVPCGSSKGVRGLVIRHAGTAHDIRGRLAADR